MKLKNPIRLAAVLSLPALVFFGCSALDKTTSAPSGLIATPVGYYSTPRARLLGEKYKVNLENIVGKVARNPKTVGLQFANNIASVGGIGFFTHSAATVPDERYLEVVLAAPELFETASEPSNRFQNLFSKYGYELLAIMAADAEMFEDRDLGGYGLNLSWRKVSNESGSPRVAVERAVAYFTKAQARAFLRREMAQADLLKNAVMFAGSEDGSMALVSVQPHETPVDFRPVIVEEDLANVAKPKPNIEPIKVEPMKAVPPPAKAPAMPAPERAKPLGNPSEPMIVVMKAEPAAKTEPPKEPAKAAPPPPKMPAPERSPGTSDVPAPVIVMVPPPAPRKAEVETRAETPTQPAPPVSNELALPAPPAAESTKLEPARDSQRASQQQDIPPAKVAAAAPVVTRQTPSAAPPPVMRPPETKEPAVQATKSIERPLASETAAGAPQSAPPSAISKSAPASAPPPAAAATIAEPVAPTPTVPTRRVENPPGERKIEPVAQAPSPSAAAKKEVPAAPEVAAPLKAAPEQLVMSPQPARELPREVPVPRASDPPAAAAPTAQPQVSAPVPERLASLPKAEASAAPEPKALPRPAPRALAGYIVQIAFSDAGAARRWAETMERKGFAVSVTEAGEPGALRVRLGNFPVRADAERQLVALRQEGLRGIVLNLPQAFLPEAASLP